MSKSDYVLVDHFRWIAALAVAIGHVRNLTMVDMGQNEMLDFGGLIFYFATGFGHQAVIAFFVISGFLVSKKAMYLRGGEKANQELKKFIIDRFSRIFIVLFPALVFTYVVTISLYPNVASVPILNNTNWSSIDTTVGNSDLDSRIWFCHLFLINEIACPTVKVNSPLWSLSYEWCYYMFVAAAAYAVVPKKGIGGWIFTLYAVLLFAAVVFLNIEILYLGLIWLCGGAARWSIEKRFIESNGLLILGAAATLAVLCFSRLNPGLFSDLLLGASLSFMLANACAKNLNYGGRIGGVLSGFSYSLYVIHLPVVIVVISSAQLYGFLPSRIEYGFLGGIVVFSLLLFCIVCAWVLSLLTERHTNALRNSLFHRVNQRVD
ncbi:acyltransferase family protein [Pyruvatibacter sp.]